MVSFLIKWDGTLGLEKLLYWNLLSDYLLVNNVAREALFIFLLACLSVRPIVVKDILYLRNALSLYLKISLKPPLELKMHC